VISADAEAGKVLQCSKRFNRQARQLPDHQVTTLSV